VRKGRFLRDREVCVNWNRDFCGFWGGGGGGCCCCC
jgi:hypothetical protein